MRAVIQRCRSARVEIGGDLVGQIGSGLVVLLGIHGDDDDADLQYLVEKIIHMRIFEDEEGKMNRSLLEIGGSMLIISQFTLYADTKRGRRPGFSYAAGSETAKPLYLKFCDTVRSYFIPVATGEFGADMDVTLTNQGPVTIILDSADRKAK